MIAPLGTLAFLATLLLIVVLGAAVLEESGAKIATAIQALTRKTRVAIGASMSTYPCFEGLNRNGLRLFRFGRLLSRDGPMFLLCSH